MYEGLRRFDPRSSWPGFLALAGLGLALAFTLLDPGPSRGLGAGLRLAFWIAHCLIPIALLEIAQIGLGRLRVLDGVSPWVRVATAGILGAALFAPVALALDAVFPIPSDASDDGRWFAELFDEFRAFAPPMLLVWLGLNATRLVSPGSQADAAKPDQPASPGDPAATLWARTPRKIGRDLVALSAELHYLRVVTTGGEALILFSFGRALPLVAGTPGVRIHRSHWVALRHIEDVRREGERVSVRLSTGLELPVSRSYRAALRAAPVRP